MLTVSVYAWIYVLSETHHSKIYKMLVFTHNHIFPQKILWKVEWSIRNKVKNEMVQSPGIEPGFSSWHGDTLATEPNQTIPCRCTSPFFRWKIYTVLHFRWFKRYNLLSYGYCIGNRQKAFFFNRINFRKFCPRIKN